MKNIYIVKHYWDEKTYGATIEPKWLFSKSNLNKEESKIKKIIEYYTGLSKYNELALNKPKFEKFEDIYVYFCYKDKDDPDPTNNRKVTDITFIISSKKLKHPCELVKKNKFVISSSNYFFYVFALFMLFLIICFFSFKKQFNNEITQVDNQNIQLNNKTIVEKTESTLKTNNVKKEKKQLNKTQLICQKYQAVLKISPKKCYQKFFYDICKNNYKNSYNKWLEKHITCKRMVKNVNKDKELKISPKELKNFIKRYPDE